MRADMSIDHEAVQRYLKVFHLIFKLSEQEAHYKMMMGKAYVELEDFVPAGTRPPVAEKVPSL